MKSIRYLLYKGVDRLRHSLHYFPLRAQYCTAMYNVQLRSFTNTFCTMLYTYLGLTQAGLFLFIQCTPNGVSFYCCQWQSHQCGFQPNLGGITCQKTVVEQYNISTTQCNNLYGVIDSNYGSLPHHLAPLGQHSNILLHCLISFGN